jgi:hypothetical protein
MIVLIALGGVVTTALLMLWRRTEYVNQPWLYAAAVAVGLATIISAVALWRWKMWGLYLYIVASLASVALGLIVFPTQLAAFYNLIPLHLVAYVLQGQKKMRLLE